MRPRAALHEWRSLSRCSPRSVTPGVSRCRWNGPSRRIRRGWFAWITSRLIRWQFSGVGLNLAFPTQRRLPRRWMSPWAMSPSWRRGQWGLAGSESKGENTFSFPVCQYRRGNGKREEMKTETRGVFGNETLPSL